jgi:phosphotransferase system HPr-like phosphotransfer protein
MDLNDFFEDLEAEFDSQYSALQNQQLSPSVLPSGPIRVDLLCRDSMHHRMIAVTLGENFLAGIDVENGSAIVINISSISRLIFTSTSKRESIEIKTSGKTFAEFVEIFAEKKSLVRLKSQNLHEDSAARIGWVRGSARNLICFIDRATDVEIFYPMESVRSIEAIDVHN